MDKNVLYYYIRRSGHSITTLCAVIGMSKSTFYRKVNGNGDFTLSEMMTIAEAVGVENPTEIFFSKEVSKMTLFTPLGGGIMKRNTVELIIGAGSFMLVLQFLCLAYLANSCNGFWIALAFVALCFCLIWVYLAEKRGQFMEKSTLIRVLTLCFMSGMVLFFAYRVENQVHCAMFANPSLLYFIGALMVLDIRGVKK